ILPTLGRKEAACRLQAFFHGADGGAVQRLRACLGQMEQGLRRRYRQTTDRRIQHASFVLRLLAASPIPEPDRRSDLERAGTRCYREIMALRMRGDVASESMLHEWLSPHIDAWLDDGWRCGK